MNKTLLMFPIVLLVSTSYGQDIKSKYYFANSSASITIDDSYLFSSTQPGGSGSAIPTELGPNGNGMLTNGSTSLTPNANAGNLPAFSDFYMGVYTDQNASDHLVIGTSIALTGITFSSLFGSISASTVINDLKNGNVGATSSPTMLATQVLNSDIQFVDPLYSNNGSIVGGALTAFYSYGGENVGVFTSVQAAPEPKNLLGISCGIVMTALVALQRRRS